MDFQSLSDSSGCLPNLADLPDDVQLSTSNSVPQKDPVKDFISSPLKKPIR